MCWWPGTPDLGHLWSGFGNTGRGAHFALSGGWVMREKGTEVIDGAEEVVYIIFSPVYKRLCSSSSSTGSALSLLCLWKSYVLPPVYPPGSLTASRCFTAIIKPWLLRCSLGVHILPRVGLDFPHPAQSTEQPPSSGTLLAGKYPNHINPVSEWNSD